MSLKKMIEELERMGLLSYVTKLPNFNDEPRVFNFRARIRDCAFEGGAVDTDENKAKFRAVMEALERYLISTSIEPFVVESSSNLKSTGSMFIDPGLFQIPDSLKTESSDGYNSSILKWVKGVNLTTGKNCLIPQQLVELTKRFDSEPKLCPSTSNGAASGLSLEGALISGILELIERDTTMLRFLKKTPAKAIDILSLPKELQKLIDQVEKYSLKVEIIDATLDFKIPTVITIIYDEGAYKVCEVSVGAKTALNKYDAIKGSLLEALQGRFFLRYAKTSGDCPTDLSSGIHSILGRGCFWCSFARAHEELEFLSSNGVVKYNEITSVHTSKVTRENLDLLLSEFSRKGYALYYYYFGSIPVAAQTWVVHVVKVISPDLQPLFLDENDFLVHKRRDREISTIFPLSLGVGQSNTIFHPFM